MVLTVTEDTPADMLAGSMELLVQIPRDHHVQTQRVTVQRSTPMMDLLVQIATAHKLAASSYTLQAIGERGLVLSHQPNTPIGALDALQVKLLPKQGTLLARKGRPASQPFETTFRLQVHLPRNQLYVSRVSPKTNLGEILDEVCREKNLDRNKYELRHPAHLSETLDLSLTLQDYHLQEVTLFPRQQARSNVSSGLSSQDIMALQKQEEHRRNQARQGVFGFMFKNKSKESSLSSDSLGNRSVSPARSDDIDGSSPVPKDQLNKQTMPAPAVPSRPLRKRRPAPKPPTMLKDNKQQTTSDSKSHSKQSSESTTTSSSDKDKIVISHSRNSSDSSGYHEASVLSDNPDNGNGGGRMPETLPRRGRMQGILEAPRKLAHTSHASKSLGNLAIASIQGGTLSRGISNTSLSSNGQRKKRVAPPPPIARPLPSAISAQGLERIVDSDESLTSDMDLSKPSSDIDAAATGSSQASSDIVCHIRSQQPEQIPVDSARVVKKATIPPTDTDILLQKVSDTLSHASITALAPPSPPPTPEDLRCPEELPKKSSAHSITKIGNADRLVDRDNREKILDARSKYIKESNSQLKREHEQKEKEEEEEGKCIVEAEDDLLPAGSSSEASSANNSTNQQDTSDYVSASGEELSSITDWEYQIPAPPSAFRDDEDTTSTEHTASKPVKESMSIEAEIHQVHPKKTAKLSSKTYIELQQPVIPEPKLPVDSVDFCQPKAPKIQTQTSTEQLKKAEVISELETKISSNKPVVVEASRTDETDAPKIAPVENNLANFTITTYSRQKSLDIFEPMDQQQHEENRVLNTFATLTRGRSLASDYADGKMGGMKSAISMERVTTGHLVDEKTKFAEKVEVLREKPVHRSKSYIILSSNEKFQNKANEVEKKKDERIVERVDYKVNESSKKMTSLVNLNTGVNDEVLNHKEKFSQWRENMLRKHEEPSPEKQLQSLQVLKSILPQLKNAQVTENNYKTPSESFNSNKRHEPQHEVIQEPPSLPSEVKLRGTANRRMQDPAKRYTYCGPPSISLGSWSERPSLNVQIKTDTDYKFGGSKVVANGSNGTSTSGARTVVNLNGGGIENEKREDEKIGYRKSVKEEKKDDEPCVDTSSVAFKDLTKAFGQEVRLRPKPVTSRNLQNRHSEYIDRPKPNSFVDSHVTTTNKVGVNRVNGSVAPVKRYTSVVGITNNNNNNNNNFNDNINKNNVINSNGTMQQNNFRFMNGQSKPTVMPVLKSVNGEEKEKEYAVPKPPTMPIITGVTLKSVNARQKSKPPMIQQDPRDQLLESIRNFGGRGNLKKSIDRY